MTDLNKNFLVLSANSTLSGRDEYNERLDNVIRSMKGTHLFNREFGYLDTLLFSELTDEKGYDLLLQLDVILSQAIPEIQLDLLKSQCIPYPDQRYYLIQLYYTISTTNESNTYQNTLEVS